MLTMNDTTEFQNVTDHELEQIQGGGLESIAVDIAVDVLLMLAYCAIAGVSCYA
jgi:bacteriocin-like protein